jgi:2-polyprenyl-3-methyl-5-hydroxy-6-metoxy-1,4-benzoquinol methylase
LASTADSPCRGDLKREHIPACGKWINGFQAFFLRSSLLDDHLHVLDAGCGAGVVALALHEALVRRRFVLGTSQAFDLTPTMLERFDDALDRHGVFVETRQANVLDMNRLALQLDELRSDRDRLNAGICATATSRRRVGCPAHA